ncbi:MAG: 5-amino-6-(D-ribitylamino)uracil--L-tyrosine 4-hydroxyphenyl transferase CofH [Acidimicrobiia bacterium]|nr:5-amino-6-(D-ribitylamino)uracil--L-tyrosine 4-hydroxyphenyl transferase CofH [Acidimicrobiia bacterium]NNL71639.1 5-amino-6-(D-ribitylamino)uracil--L-tyrosine 4-hydroxyphenyl transferase CofH [Acidimicrobiia bacterium]
MRTGRSRVARARRIVEYPAVDAVVSVFVDTVEDALAAVEEGATDLLLRAWDRESIGQLRDAVGSGELVERTALWPDPGLDEIREAVDAELFATYLNQVDGTGRARPRYDWAPGKPEDPPVPARRLSLQWSDAEWLGRTARPGIDHLEPGLRSILTRSLAGRAPSRDEIEMLFRARGHEVEAIAEVADELRRRRNGDVVTYVVNRNINYTNQCYFRCGFCAFSKGPKSLNLRGDPYLLTLDEVVDRTRQAWERGATEVTLQGGIHPEFTGDFYVHVTELIKAAVPEMHVHGFTPLEVWQGAETTGATVPEFLARLKAAGLGTLPGTAAEILDDDVRRHLCPDKIRTAEWAYVMTSAHELGLRSTSTIMFGHIDGPASWANHLEVLRQIQRRTGGITEFVPLPFVHMGAPIYLRGRSRPGPTWDEVVLIHAVARIALDGLIDNIQASWVKLGLEGGRRLLEAGCNDMGGTLMDENISRAAGAAHGQLATPEELEATIRAAGRTPARRNTVYELIESSPRTADR